MEVKLFEDKRVEGNDRELHIRVSFSDTTCNVYETETVLCYKDVTVTSAMFLSSTFLHILAIDFRLLTGKPCCPRRQY